MTYMLDNEHILIKSGRLRGHRAPVGVIDGTYKKYADIGALYGSILEDNYGLECEDKSIISLQTLSALGVKYETVYPVNKEGV